MTRREATKIGPVWLLETAGEFDIGNGALAQLMGNNDAGVVRQVKQQETVMTSMLRLRGNC